MNFKIIQVSNIWCLNMKIINKLLLKSNSYNYYKTNFENLKKENEKLKNQIIKLDKDYNNSIQKNNSQHIKEIRELNSQQKKEMNKLNEVHKKEMSELHAQHKNEIDKLNTQHRNEMNNNFNSMKKDLFTLKNSENVINNELKYAFIFNDTIKNSSWLDKTDFSLVNSAANYSFMYSLYRILNDAKPENILELGLGQTTKLTSQYANQFDNVKLTVLETDDDWIGIFSENLNITDNINIIQLDDEPFEYNNTTNIRFKDIEKVVGDEKYDLIIIDGPRGFISGPDGDRLLDYSRTNIWQLIPSNLANDFIIIIDDYERKGEKNTMNHAEKMLEENNIELFTYTCRGLKAQHAIFTEKYKFISWI